MISLQLMAYMVYSLPLAFFPQVAFQKGISYGWIGLILSIYALGQILSGIVISRFLDSMDRRSLLYWNIILSSVTVAGFGCINLINNHTLYVIFGCVFRFLSGFIEGAIATILFAYIPILYPESISQKQAYFETAFGLASILGSVFGGLIYNLIGF